MSVSITTNNHVRPLLAYYELPESALEWFYYVDEEEHYSPRFVIYKGDYYDMGDTPSVDNLDDLFPAWHGVVSLTYFSGVLFRFATDTYGEEGVIVGSYYCD